MRADWHNITVSQLVSKGEAEIKTGPFGTQLHASDYVEEGTPVINARNIGFGNIRPEKLEFISDETVKRLSSHLLKPADIVFGRKGTVERHVFIRPAQNNWFQGTDCLRLRLKSPDVEPRYVSYYFLTENHKQWIINQSSHGATMTSLNQDIISRISFPLPPLATQRKIVDVLSAYDELIEVNTRRIRVLEQMAQSVYREWFGKVDARGGAAALPEGWEIKPFSELVDIDPAVSVDKQIQKPFVGMNALSTNSMLIDLGLVEMRTGSSGAKFQNRDVLFPRITPSVENGKAGFVQFLKDGQVAIGSTEIIVFREKELVSEYIYFLSREHEFRGNAINSMIGASGRQRVQQGCFDTFLVAKPPKELQQKFAEIVSPMFKITHTLALKNANLRRTRDLLLPRLVGGEVTVHE
jgi:type I restriction enzyme S subunit